LFTHVQRNNAFFALGFRSNAAGVGVFHGNIISRPIELPS
jgi:hypothetical protein